MTASIGAFGTETRLAPPTENEVVISLTALTRHNSPHGTSMFGFAPGCDAMSQHQAHTMDYQLVIKFWRTSLADEAFLATIESDLKEVLGKGAEQDGYDVSAKEINLFVLTADPRQAFRKAKSVLEIQGIERGVSAAFRLVGGARFTSIWPLRALRKFTLP